MRMKLLLFAFAAILLPASAFAQSTAITDARIVTVSGATIERGTVVIRDGLIEAVGAGVNVPADARVIDAAGHTVYPGFFDAVTSLGLQTRPATPQGGPGGGQAAQQQAAAQSNSRYLAGLRPEVTAAEDLRAGEGQFEQARNAGFTTAISVGRTGIFNGRSAVINLAGEDVAGMIVKSPAAIHVSYATLGFEYPGSLMGTISAIRQMLYDAKRLQEMQKMYAANPRGMRRPDADASLEALIPVVDRQMPIIFNANREIEIIRAIDLAKEFNLRLIIAGGQESWKVADRLKAIDAAVLFSLNFPKRTTAASPDADPESLDLLRFRAEVPKAAGRLAQAGVRFAFQSGGMTNLADFSANAAMAVQNGLSADAAVRAMTLSPAEIFGIADRTGSVETGKIANLTVIKGDALAKDRVVTHVFVDGKLFEPKAPPARPAGNPGTGTGPAAAVAGTYNVTIDVPGQPLTGSMNFSVQGQSMTGNLTTQLGTAPIRNGRLTGNRFSFDATVAYGGANIDIQVSGTVTGNRIEGSIDSPQGAVPFSGTRVP